MLHVLKFLLKPLKTEFLMILLGMKTVVMILTVCWLLIVANAIAAATQQQQQQQQPQTLNYKQQLQYQMQQHDKFQYQQHIKQQQQYYQKQQHLQQIPTASMALEQQQQEQQHYQRTPQQYLAVKPTQMLQTAASLVVDDGGPPLESLGQPEFSNGNTQRRRPGTRKRKRRPQMPVAEEPTGPTASNSPPYWRGHVDDQEALNVAYKSSTTKSQDNEETARPSLQASFKRRKQSAIREPFSALEKEQKLYEMRNKPEPIAGDGNANRSSVNLKNILKNSGGLSLSEILQQKNLSLDDLLKGKQNALQALQTTAPAPLEKVNHAKFPSFKANYKHNTPNVRINEELSEEVYNSKERSKLSALQRLKLFGSSSRPTGLQVGLADHLTTRKREGVIYSSSTTTISTSTTARPSTTKIPLYKKILHQRPTLKPTFLLKNTGILASAETQREVTSWDSKEFEEIKEEQANETKHEAEEEGEEQEEDIEVTEDEEELKEEVIEYSTKLPEITTWRMETTTGIPSTTTNTYPTTTSTSSTTTTSTTKPTSEKPINRDLATSTRRMFTSTRGSGRTTFRYSTSTSHPAKTSTTTTSTTTTTVPPTTTTTTTTSTTTASSSTMNLTPKANHNLNTDDLRERIQETLLKNLIEKEDSYKKSPIMNKQENENIDDDDDDDLENFFEETVKPKTTKYIETSTITTRMKQYTPSFIYTSSTTSSPTIMAAVTTEKVDVIPDFDNVDDRTDLLELIEDRRSGNRLFKVLEQRNMTLEELIEHRKRGSSQLHLATIVESPSRFYPDKKVVLQDNMDIVTAFENFPHFNLLNLKSVKPDDIKTDSQGSSYFTSIIDIEPTDEVYKNRKGGQTINVDLDKASLLADRSEKSLGFFPNWKTLALASLATSSTNNNDAVVMRNNDINPFFLQQPKMLLENNSESNDNDDDEDNYDIRDNEVNLTSRNDEDNDNNEDDYREQNPIQAAVSLPDRTAEAIENEVARAHDLVDLELSGHGFKRSPQAAGALAHSHRRGSFYTNMPPGIKSAIVASATIVLTALITFMVIFAVCKWKQRRHRMTNIMKSYNAMKSKLPTIAATTSTRALNVNGSCTNPNSRRSSFREMQDLLGGSSLSVAATITTTSTGVPNTPIHTTKTHSNPLNSTQTTTLMTAGQCSKNINSIYGHSTNISNSGSSSNNSNSNCGMRPLQRQSSLLFQRSFRQNNNSNSNSNNEKPTNLSILSGCNLLDLKRNNKMSGSTTSLSFSLTSGHNISNSHINTMNANSPEVQEYLFDTLRNSF